LPLTDRCVMPNEHVIYWTLKFWWWNLILFWILSFRLSSLWRPLCPIALSFNYHSGKNCKGLYLANQATVPSCLRKNHINSAWNFIKHYIAVAEMSSECVSTFRCKCMVSEEEMYPIISVELVAQHTPTSAYIMTLSGLTWETCVCVCVFFLFLVLVSAGW